MDTPFLPATAPILVSTFYKFVNLPHYRELKPFVREEMTRLGVKGTITLAPEGVNATISGPDQSVAELIAFLEEEPAIGPLTDKKSRYDALPFQRSKVKAKRELISLGVPVNPVCHVGEYVQAKDWNALIARPDVLTIDTRNAYEFRIGHFERAVNPDTQDFKQMVSFTEKHLDTYPDAPIAMYCTGGIRCEKYSSYLVERGFRNIFHLQGGILQYLEEIAPEDSLWRGSCFVFDERVAVGHGVVKDPSIIMCPGCGNPLMPQDRADASYIADQSCRYCD